MGFISLDYPGPQQNVTHSRFCRSPASRFDWGGSSKDAPLFVGNDPTDRHVQGFKMSLSNEIGQYVGRGGGSYSKVVKKDLENIEKWLRARGVERCTMVGFCYG